MTLPTNNNMEQIYNALRLTKSTSEIDYDRTRQEKRVSFVELTRADQWKETPLAPFR